MGYFACQINGRRSDAVSPDNRGLAYGDGLFETVLVRRRQPLWLDDHLQRLQDGARRLAIPLDKKTLGAEIAAFLANSAGSNDAVLKVVLCRGSAGRGYFAAPVESERILLLSSAPPPSRHWQSGVKLALCQTRMSSQPELAGIKHLNRLEQVLAAAELSRRGFGEGLLMDDSGALIEASRSNVFLVKSDSLYTPMLDRCGIDGIMRRQIMKFSECAGIACKETRLTMADFLAADEGFVCNSLFGIWPISSLECINKPVGPLTRRIQEEFGVVFGA